jgi:hypothetical protein
MTLKVFFIVIAYISIVNIITWTIILRMIYFTQMHKDPLIAYIDRPKLEKKVKLEDMELIG